MMVLLERGMVKGHAKKMYIGQYLIIHFIISEIKALAHLQTFL